MREAFRCQGANLLPFANFVSNGFLSKRLGQVDLPGAPLKHPSPDTLPSRPCRCDFTWLYSAVVSEACGGTWLYGAGG
ncbi:hypothetical protein K040078D81_02400 [Blautia hominis]|uniref:Uncharacterized protein n=1 Tax=Blautia hominis TaxID=2025493 RepID=A0ABQ0B3X3_9FIRM